MFCSVNYNFTGEAICLRHHCFSCLRCFVPAAAFAGQYFGRNESGGQSLWLIFLVRSSTASFAMCFHFDIYAPHSDSDVSRNVRKDIFPVAVPLCNCLFHVWLISVGSGEPCQVICNSCICQYFVLNKKLQYASSYMLRIVVVCVNGISVTSHD